MMDVLVVFNKDLCVWFLYSLVNLDHNIFCQYKGFPQLTLKTD